MWLAWLSACALSGPAAGFVEWLAFGERPGVHWVIAAVAGSILSGLSYQLVRGGGPRFGGITSIAIGGLIGAKSGSVIKAMVFGGVISILSGFFTRAIERRRDGPRSSESKSVGRVPSDSSPMSGGLWDRQLDG